MGALTTLVCIMLGLPVAVLFAAGYLLRQRRSRVEAMFGTSEFFVPEHHSGSAGGNGHGSPLACWETKNCTLAKRDKCPAYDRTYLPCWLALKLANGGRLERACPRCVLYQPERIVEGVAPAAKTAAEAG